MTENFSNNSNDKDLAKKFCSLNKQFMQFLDVCYSQNRNFDFTPILQDYIKYSTMIHLKAPKLDKASSIDKGISNNKTDMPSKTAKLDEEPENKKTIPISTKSTTNMFELPSSTPFFNSLRIQPLNSQNTENKSIIDHKRDIFDNNNVSLSFNQSRFDHTPNTQSSFPIFSATNVNLTLSPNNQQVPVTTSTPLLPSFDIAKITADNQTKTTKPTDSVAPFQIPKLLADSKITSPTTGISSFQEHMQSPKTDTKLTGSIFNEYPELLNTIMKQSNSFTQQTTTTNMSSGFAPPIPASINSLTSVQNLGGLAQFSMPSQFSSTVSDKFTTIQNPSDSNVPKKPEQPPFSLNIFNMPFKTDNQNTPFKPPTFSLNPLHRDENPQQDKLPTILPNSTPFNSIPQSFSLDTLLREKPKDIFSVPQTSNLFTAPATQLFGSIPDNRCQSPNQDNDEENVPESTDMGFEAKAVCSVRSKLFFLNDTKYEELGVGIFNILPLEGDPTHWHIVFRMESSRAGSVLMNIKLNKNLKNIQIKNNTNLIITTIPNPPIDQVTNDSQFANKFPTVSYLIKTKSAADMNTLVTTLNRT